jgi:hypothetical protein
LGTNPSLIDYPAISEFGLSPDKVVGPPGSNTPPDTPLLSLETKQYSIGEGGDVGTGKGGDSGGYNTDYRGSTWGTAWNDDVSVQQPYLPKVEAEANAGNEAAATQVLWDNTNSMFVGAVDANTSDLGQGYSDLGNGALAAVGAVGSTAAAAAAFSEGNIFGGIVASAGAISSTEKAYQDFTTPAARDALNDILNSLNRILQDWDSSWDQMWSDGDAAGLPGAAKVYNYLQSDGIHPAFAASHSATHIGARSVTDTVFPAHHA